MVQMKVVSDYINKNELSLYIPHGSDERLSFFGVGIERTCFISHMVQMKVETSGGSIVVKL